MNVPVTGQIAGKPWRAALDYGEAPALMRHLGTAAFIVCAYLTGMRPGEKRAELHLMQHSADLSKWYFRSSSGRSLNDPAVA
jgi:hypothetical protein